MPADAFRPRSTSEILDASIQLLRTHYSGFLVLSVIALLPQVAANMYHVMVLVPQYGDRAVLYSSPLLVVALVWFVLGDAAVVVAASDAYLGHGIDSRKALRQALHRSGTIVLAAILKYLLIGLGFLAVMIAASVAAVIVGAIIAGIVAALGAGLGGVTNSPAFLVTTGVVVGVLFAVASIWWMLITFTRLFAYRVAIVIEGLGASASLHRSSNLARGEVMKIFLAFLLMYVIYAAVWLLAFTIAYFASSRSDIAQTTAGVVVLFIYPIIPIVTTLLYYDLRIRKEGYDIELMMETRDSGLGTRDSARLVESEPSPPRPFSSPESRVPSP